MLQLRRERFTEELESYSKQMEEFQSYGDMSEIQRYLKKAQTLDTKLQAAADKVGLPPRPGAHRPRIASRLSIDKNIDLFILTNSLNLNYCSTLCISKRRKYEINFNLQKA